LYGQFRSDLYSQFPGGFGDGMPAIFLIRAGRVSSHQGNVAMS
jgi:hypothetical protein